METQLNVGYRTFFDDRERGEAEFKIFKKTFYKVGYSMAESIPMFSDFFQHGKYFFFAKNCFHFVPNPHFNVNM